MRQNQPPASTQLTVQSPTIGSTNLTPLSSGGLWLAVIITPTTRPFNFLDRKAANKPTRKTTESRRVLANERFSGHHVYRHPIWHVAINFGAAPTLSCETASQISLNIDEMRGRSLPQFHTERCSLQAWET